ncbi:hypothetical protein GPJ56_008422 [Histomonas meleagridis]|uniref:uncharacterized protein n=1 Tax=Histomonas meleagridis TaxID=135588 RepID=UPI00355A1DE0|nr:hypothetical protein GPJ56_008422 [Histomonas meleagridis]KAH0806478.1 hypothetical protein GO595_000640 [Histomonas meleagridis]
MTFLVFGLLSTLITILRSTDEKCSNAFAEFWAAIPGLPEKEANEFNNYWNKLTDGKAEYEVEDYKNDWFKDRCQRPHSTIEGYFIAYIICLVIIIFVYVIQYISNSNYQSLDIQYVSSDERHLLGDIEDE